MPPLENNNLICSPKIKYKISFSIILDSVFSKFMFKLLHPLSTSFFFKKTRLYIYAINRLRNLVKLHPSPKNYLIWAPFLVTPSIIILLLQSHIIFCRSCKLASKNYDRNMVFTLRLMIIFRND